MEYMDILVCSFSIQQIEGQKWDIKYPKITAL